MKPPKIPFMPLLLKGLTQTHTHVHTLGLFNLQNLYLACVFPFFLDITFIHEGNKTFHDNLVNFEKLVSLIFWAQIHILATNIRPVIHPVS